MVNSSTNTMIAEYQELRSRGLPVEEHLQQFGEFAKKYFEPADDKTRAYRARCLTAGVSAVSAQGMSNEAALEIIESDEVQRIAHGNNPTILQKLLDGWQFFHEEGRDYVALKMTGPILRRIRSIASTFKK